MRESGILMPIFSIPSKYGIGTMSDEAYRFVDFLEKSGQGFWQVLPLGPTGYGNSPYQPLSAYAGNPYLIAPDKLVEDGLLTWDECNSFDFGSNVEKVDYGLLYENRSKLLRKAHERFIEKKANDKSLAESYEKFQKDNASWLEDFALYYSIKATLEGKPWYEWPEDLKTRKQAALDDYKKEHASGIEFIIFRQYLFATQWEKLHEYAKSKNIKIIGDMPFYLSLDSADVWQHPEVFKLDKDLVPEVVAGCPPDAFSATGQMWGNPIYDWAAEKKNGYAWWISRMQRNLDLFDVVRIDHFHGFAEYYAIPYDAKDATKGEQCKGPGMDFFNALYKKLGKVNLIAEDLGTVTKENVALLEDSGIPGMNVLQYAFTSWDSKYMTHRHVKNSVTYTGTHDNSTLLTWAEEIQDGHRDFARRYVNSRNSDFGGLVWDIIREAYHSVSDLCIIPLTDYLVKGREARINTPGTMDGNWEWRLVPNFLSDDLARSIRELAETYGRIPQKGEEKCQQ